MKKKILTIACCATLLSISSIAYSAEGPYVSGNLGLAIDHETDVTDSTLPGITIDIESDYGLALGAAVGYAYACNARLEAEIAYQKNNMDKARALGSDSDLNGDASSLALLLNGYYDFKNASAFTPFVGAGIGIANVEVNDFYVSRFGLQRANDDDTVFAYQVGAGLGYAVNETVTIDAKYRYFKPSNPHFDTTKFDYSSHNIYAGIRVGF